MNQIQIEEYARLIDVPILRAGHFTPQNGGKKGVDISESQLDEMIATFEECKDILQESINTGEYRENPSLMANLQKPIPALLNLNHQNYLNDTIKNACKNVSLKLGKKLIDGANWLVATFENVPNDIAPFIKDKFPYRSIEIIPKLYHAGKKKWFSNVLRAVSFLEPGMPPAVGGQNRNLAIEFANDSIIMLFSSVVTEAGEPAKQQEQPNEVISMDEKKKDLKSPETPVVPESPKKDREAVSPIEFEKMKVDIAEYRQRTEAAEERAKAAEERANQAQSEAQIEREKREEGEIREFCNNLAHDLHVSPAALKLIQPILEKLDNKGVLEFSEEKKESARKAVEGLIKGIIEMKKDDALIVPIGEFAGDAVQKDEPHETIEDKQRAKIVEFAEAARGKASDPNNQQEVWRVAYDMAIDAAPELFN